MRILIGLGLGAALATIIACAPRGASPKEATTATAAEPPPGAGGMPQAPTRDEIDRLDQSITDEMAKLGEQRPTPPPTACVSNCSAQQLSGAAVAATAPDAECKPGKGQKCTDACTLKDSI